MNKTNPEPKGKALEKRETKQKKRTEPEQNNAEETKATEKQRKRKG